MWFFFLCILFVYFVNYVQKLQHGCAMCPGSCLFLGTKGLVVYKKCLLVHRYILWGRHRCDMMLTQKREKLVRKREGVWGEVGGERVDELIPALAAENYGSRWHWATTLIFWSTCCICSQLITMVARCYITDAKEREHTHSHTHLYTTQNTCSSSASWELQHILTETSTHTPTVRVLLWKHLIRPCCIYPNMVREFLITEIFAWGKIQY